MKIKLKMLKGSNEGREVKIPMPKCLIGRGDDCHVRPKSDAISRRHCVIYVKQGTVYIRDLKSRNGTVVNGKKTEGDVTLSSGDVVQVGPMTFEMVIDHSLGGEKKSKVKSIKDAATRTTTSGSDSREFADGDIGSWLDEADEVERGRRLTDPETRHLKLDETDRVDMQKAIEARAKASAVSEAELGDAKKEADPAEEDEEKKKKPGKLPPRADQATRDSREAASDMLKKFFNNR